MKNYLINAQGKEEVQKLLDLNCQILAMYPDDLLVSCTRSQYNSICHLGNSYHWRVRENQSPALVG